MSSCPGAALWGRCGPWWDCLRACSQLSPSCDYQVGLCLSGEYTCRPCSYPHLPGCCPTQALAPGGQANHQLEPGQPHHLSAPGFLAKAPELTRRHLKPSLPSLASFLGTFPNDPFIFLAPALYTNPSAATVSSNHLQMVALPSRPRPASQMMVALLGPCTLSWA